MKTLNIFSKVYLFRNGTVLCVLLANFAAFYRSARTGFYEKMLLDFLLCGVGLSWCLSC